MRWADLFDHRKYGLLLRFCEALKERDPGGHLSAAFLPSGFYRFEKPLRKIRERAGRVPYLESLIEH